MKKLVYILLFLIVSCYSSGNSEFIRMFIEKNSDVIKILRNNKTQIKLSIIDKNKGFNEYEYNVDANQYFYPASTVKLPIALFALEKLNEYKYLSIDTPFMLEDDTLKTTMRRELEKIFVLSDNQANNRLFEFLGQDYINQKFISKGMNESRIFHRLSTTNSSNLNGKRVDFFLNDSIISFQNKNIAPSKLNLKGVKKGIGYINQTGSLIKEPMNFSDKNFISINDLHKIIKILFFPDKFEKSERFNLTQLQKDVVFKYMSGYPKEFGYNEKEYPYFFNKFFIYGDEKLEFSNRFKIFNKVGLAYGFVVDNAYIVDTKNNIEFLLTAVIYSNSNQTMNDDEYDYEKISIPFLASLGRKIYDLELRRFKKMLPDLSLFKNI